MIELLSLREHPVWIPDCAVWNFEQWGREAGRTYDETLHGLQKIADSGDEHALLALLEGRPAGMGLLIECDLPSHAHLMPWVAGLLTLPDFRGRGVASALLAELESRARLDGHDAAYLYTATPEFYEPRGWRRIEVLQPGEQQRLTVMEKRW